MLSSGRTQFQERKSSPCSLLVTVASIALRWKEYVRSFGACLRRLPSNRGEYRQRRELRPEGSRVGSFPPGTSRHFSQRVCGHRSLNICRVKYNRCLLVIFSVTDTLYGFAGWSLRQRGTSLLLGDPGHSCRSPTPNSSVWWSSHQARCSRRFTRSAASASQSGSLSLTPVAMFLTISSRFTRSAICSL